MKMGILESLKMNRDSKLLLEAVDASVKSGFKQFLNAAKLDQKQTTKVRKALNDLFLACDEVGKNTFKYGKFEQSDPTFDDGDAENGPGSYYDPGANFLNFYIFFDNGNLITENLETLRTILSKRYHHKTYNEMDGVYMDDNPSTQDVEGATIRLWPNSKKGYISVEVASNRKNSSEGTDVSGVATPDGKVGAVTKRKEIQSIAEKNDSKQGDKKDPKNVVCPKCGSEDVNIHNDGTIFHCVTCGYEWDVKDADDCGKADDEESPEEIKQHMRKKVDTEDKKDSKKDPKKSVDEEYSSLVGGRYFTTNMGYISVVSIKEGQCYAVKESGQSVVSFPVDESVKEWVEVRERKS